MLTNGNHTGCSNFVGGASGVGGNGTIGGPTNTIENCAHDDTIEVALTSDYCQQHQHTHQLM